ncbi:hypothetical protein HHI36_003125 [Cryptolaemus montrouzieri]|uniref:Androgen-dependent TFPI-regulating protein-like n=1 Tax=Cryptolaemus montrouzieri TaxID=559131 RepID=A0ABD2PCJ3_9CUCU
MAYEVKLIFHCLALTTYLVAIIWQLNFMNASLTHSVEVMAMINFKERYFTGWNFIVHVIYFSLALSEDIQEIATQKTRTKKTRSSITYLKAYIFTMFIVPFSVFVTSMFWGLYHYNRELVYPTAMDEVFPSWFNHIIHTCIFIFMVLEFNFIGHHPEFSFRSIFLGMTVTFIVYYTVFFYHYSTVGYFLYPVFHLFSWSEIIGFLAAIYFFSLFMSRFGITVQNFIKTAKCKTK